IPGRHEASAAGRGLGAFVAWIGTRGRSSAELDRLERPTRIVFQGKPTTCAGRSRSAKAIAIVVAARPSRVEGVTEPYPRAALAFLGGLLRVAPARRAERSRRSRNPARPLGNRARVARFLARFEMMARRNLKSGHTSPVFGPIHVPETPLRTGSSRPNHLVTRRPGSPDHPQKPTLP